MSTPAIVITGVGLVLPPTLTAHLDNPAAPAPMPPPEITAFETPADAPAWGFEIVDFKLDAELPHIKSFVDRTSAFALVAGKRALTQAGLGDKNARPAELEVGCTYGSMFGCLEAMGIFWTKVKTSNPKFAQPLPFTHGYANSPSSLLCIEYGLRGPAATFSGEANAGLEALLFAHDQLAGGAGEAILVCASESLTSALYLHLLAEKKLSATGDPTTGIVPGEGGVALLLETAASAAKRNARVLSTIGQIDVLAGRVQLSGPQPLNIAEIHRHGGTLFSVDALAAVAGVCR